MRVASSKLIQSLTIGSFVMLVHCVSAGDKTLTGVTAGAGSTCGQYCRHIAEAGCPTSATCEADCKAEVKKYADCPSQKYFSCASVRAVTCNDDGTISIPLCEHD